MFARTKTTAALTALLSLTALAGCSSASSPAAESEVSSSGSAVAGDPATGTLPVREDGRIAFSMVTPEFPQAADFVAQFRAALPAVAGSAERPDKYVLKNGTAACEEIQAGTDQASQISHAQAYVVGNDVVTPATEEEAATIITIAVATLCPA
jgi:hypothetical protein